MTTLLLIAYLICGFITLGVLVQVDTYSPKDKKLFSSDPLLVAVWIVALWWVVILMVIGGLIAERIARTKQITQKRRIDFDEQRRRVKAELAKAREKML